VTTRGLRRVAGGLLALMILGCGLGKYEDEMRAAQNRVDRFQEEANVLGDPVAIPLKRVVVTVPADTTKKDGLLKKDDKKAPPPPKETAKEEKKPVIEYPFFFRPPRAIRSVADPEPVGGIAYRYPKVGGALVVPGTKPAATPTTAKPGTGPDLTVAGPSATGFLDMFLAFSNEPAGIFADKLIKVFPRTSDSVTVSQRPIDVPDRRDPISYDLREFTDAQSAWSIFVHNENGQSVAVVFRVEKARKGSLDRAIELSLATLAMWQEAGTVSASYARRK
jgi:hypothetical protein